MVENEHYLIRVCSVLYHAPMRIPARMNPIPDVILIWFASGLFALPCMHRGVAVTSWRARNSNFVLNPAVLNPAVSYSMDCRERQH